MVDVYNKHTKIKENIILKLYYLDLILYYIQGSNILY